MIRGTTLMSNLREESFIISLLATQMFQGVVSSGVDCNEAKDIAFKLACELMDDADEYTENLCDDSEPPQ